MQRSPPGVWRIRVRGEGIGSGLLYMFRADAELGDDEPIRLVGDEGGVAGQRVAGVGAVHHDRSPVRQAEPSAGGSWWCGESARAGGDRATGMP